jgi:hypothetical protein
MMQKQSIEFIGNGKHNMKIWYRDQICFTAFDPCFSLGILAFGAMTIAAAIITYANMPALIALVNMSAQC